MTIDEWERHPEAQDAVLRSAMEFQRAAERDGSASERILADLEATRLRALAARPKVEPPKWRIG